VDVIGGSYVNGKTQNTIFSFFPKVSHGYKIVENPRNLVNLPVIVDKINKMETVVTDQNGKQLNLLGENLAVTYHLREILLHNTGCFTIVETKRLGTNPGF